jgi:hypothetical protein
MEIIRSPFEAFLQKFPFASARVLAQHLFLSVSTVNKNLQRWAPHSLSPVQKGARAEMSIEMSRFLAEAKPNDFDGIVTGDES